MASITTATVGRNSQVLAPAPVVGVQASVVTVINLDTANTVNLGSSATYLPLELGPLASLTLTAPVWAQAATDALEIGIIPGGASYSPGSLTITGPVTAEISGPVDATVTGTVDISAGSVDVTGIGGYIAPGAYSLLLNDMTTHTLTSNASYTTSVYNMTTFQSYTVAVRGYCGTQFNSGAPLCVPVVVSYYADAAATILVDTERWWMWVAGGPATAMPIHGSGPLRGGYMTVTVSNLDGTESMSVNEITIYGAGRSLDASVWQQTAPPTMIAIGASLLTSSAYIYPLPGDDKILANENSNSLPASTAVWLPLPLFSGTVSMYFQVSATLANDFVVASAQGLQNNAISPGTATQGVLWNVPSVATTQYATEIEAGNAPMYIVLHTNASTPSFTFTAQGH